MYWKKRNIQRMIETEKESDVYINRVVGLYENTLMSINKEISKMFKEFMQNEKISKQEALKLLSIRETRQFYKDLLVEIQQIQDKTIREKLMRQYSASSYNYRINRLQALKQKIYIKCKSLGATEQQLNKELLTNIIDYSYYSTIFDMQKDLGYYFDFAKINDRLLESLLLNKWVGKGNFSSRIWNNTEILANQLQRILTSGLTIGKSIPKMSEDLKQTMNVAEHCATRLIRTESNYYCNQAEKLAYIESGVEEYTYLATLDVRTCKKCADLDLKTFKVKDIEVGENYPPIHANDRCTTMPGRQNIEELKRIARNPETNQNYILDKALKYNDWYKKHVKGN